VRDWSSAIERMADYHVSIRRWIFS